MLNDDLSLDYDSGGLQMSFTVLLDVFVFAVVLFQMYHEGFDAILGPPSSYCAYAFMYITCCLFKIFTLATKTFEEQQKHITILQQISVTMMQTHSHASGVTIAIADGPGTGMTSIGYNELLMLLIVYVYCFICRKS